MAEVFFISLPQYTGKAAVCRRHGTSDAEKFLCEHDVLGHIQQTLELFAAKGPLD